MDANYEWRFPLPRTHTGMLLGNGTFGAMVWGGGNVLNITLGRADFWDHRGGKPWTERMTFARIRTLLEAGDERGLAEIFGKEQATPGEPRRPSVVPIGRVEVVFEEGTVLVGGTVKLVEGAIVVRVAGRERRPSPQPSPGVPGEGAGGMVGGAHPTTMPSEGRVYEIRLDLAMHEQVLHVSWPAELGVVQVRRVPSWQYVGEYLKSVSFDQPRMFQGQSLSGWVQLCPADPALCVGYRGEPGGLWVTAMRGGDGQQAREAAERTVELAASAGAVQLRRRNRDWWSAYWKTTPKIDLPNERLSFLYNYGMYKFAGLTNPDGVAATLQGPWIEEYQMPPWSSDYHFNINVQMCYWPAYRGNKLHHLPRLFDMIWSWRDRLREHARLFVGIDDGLMLPHAVDDRCAIMGGFWSGTVDHGCTAWVGKMMYDYWLYGGGDERFLREVAYPFMYGAMRVYEEMLERQGDAFVLPVSVSPEYRGAAMNAWGRNASFQLACIHWLAEALGHASQVLGIKPRPIWREVQEKLPRACLLGDSADDRQIALWEGTPLEESHRHHSHLAGIAPFDVIDIDDPAWQGIIGKSYRNWIVKGMGMWSGWCVPWAAMLHLRVGNADMAQLLLEIWQKVYTNEGGGTLHDCQFPGFTLIGAGYNTTTPKTREIMQMDAGMGATAAIMEMMLHTRRGVNYLFTGAPASWKNVAFENIRTEGAFLVSASRREGKVSSVRVTSERGGVFRLASLWEKRVIEIEMQAGQTAEIDAANS